jgi:hypothetical protein
MPTKKQLGARSLELEAELDAIVRKDLRDEFAKAALVGLIHHYHEHRGIGPDPFGELARVSYVYADAMLTEREKQPEAPDAVS